MGQPQSPSAQIAPSAQRPDTPPLDSSAPAASDFLHRKSILKKYLKPENGIPSSDTILRVLARIDAKQPEKVFIDYAREAFGKKLPENEGKKALETARLMKQANCEIPFIEKMTGLSQEEVEAII